MGTFAFSHKKLFDTSASGLSAVVGNTKWSFIQCLGSIEKRTVKILKIGTPEIITIIVPQLEQMNFTVQYCVQKMQTE